MAIETDRLRLLGFTPQHLLALLEGEREFEVLFGLPPSAGLRDFFTSGEVSPLWLERLRSSREADPWVHGFALVHKLHRVVIGTASFKGPPDDEGMVEIAYGVVPTYQAQGYATEAAKALIAYAFDCGRVRLVRAHTAPAFHASAGVLAKCGFERVGEIIDPEDGLVWRWERPRELA